MRNEQAEARGAGKNSKKVILNTSSTQCSLICLATWMADHKKGNSIHSTSSVRPLKLVQIKWLSEAGVPVWRIQKNEWKSSPSTPNDVLVSSPLTLQYNTSPTDRTGPVPQQMGTRLPPVY